MKRVELVVRVDKDKCQRFGGVGAWDKLKAGQFPDVSMGCAPAGSRILMADGRQVPIELVREGDLVVSHTGEARRVEILMRRKYEGALYRFKVYGFRRWLSLTDEHPLWLVRADQFDCGPSTKQVNKGRRQRRCTPLVKQRSKGCTDCRRQPDYRFDWVRADEVDVGDYLAFPVPSTINETIQSEDEARLLGYYLAEGFVENYNERPLEQITFCLNLLEKELADEIEMIARRLGASVVWHDEQPDKGGRYVHVISKDLASKCLRYCGTGAKIKQVSSEILYMPVERQLRFLGAYLDGDGGTYEGSVYFSTASEQLSGQLFVMLARCGMIASVNEIEHSPSEKSVVRKDTIEYQVWVGTDFSPVLGPFTRKPVRASIKMRGQRFFHDHEGTRYIMSPVMEIEEQAYGDAVYNFSVEGDDSYVVEGLAVHNCKVPFDTCSICLDWELYREAQATFDPKRHRHPGEAVLQFHKRLIASGKRGIRGLAITRVDYCEHARRMMNKILPDGRKVFVYNDYPRFFDISFVFIGADKTAKVMAKIAEQSTRAVWSLPSAELAESLGYADFADAPLEKSASIDDLLKEAFLGKSSAQKKDAEISKDIVPSQFAGQAVPILSNVEHDLPTDLIDRMSTMPIDDVLGTTTALGMILRPREFQRLVMGGMGLQREADVFADQGVVFSKQQSDEQQNRPFGHSPLLSRLLEPFLEERSAFGPFIEKRITIMIVRPQQSGTPASHNSELLRKIGTAYDGYRKTAMHYLPEAIEKFDQRGSPDALAKLSTVSIDRVITPLTFAYFQDAFLDEAPCGKTAQADVSRRVEGRLPQRTRVL